MKFNLIDVGSDGLVSEVWKKEYINHIMTFDPLDINGEKSITPYTGVRYHYPIAISNFPGKKKFYICRNSHMSSLFEPDMNSLSFYFGEIAYMFDIVETVEIYCGRLDDVIRKTNVKFDFLKVDAQGAELNVLKSTGAFLSNFKGIQVECNHVSLYKGAPTTNDINDFLESQGFILLKKLFYKRHSDVLELVWNDCLYINNKISLVEKEFISNIYISDVLVDRGN